MKIKVRSYLHGGVVELDVRPIDTAKDVRDAVHREERHRSHLKGMRERVYFRGRELPNNRTLLEAWVEDGSTLVLAVAPRGLHGRRGHGRADVDCGVEAYGSVRSGSRLARCLAEAQLGFAKGIAPQLSRDGEGGTYFLSGASKGDFVAAFKPRDEEPMAPANPKRFRDNLGSTGLRAGVLSGEAYQREVAAYLLDHGNFAGVPETVMAVAFHDAFCNVAPASSPSASSDAARSAEHVANPGGVAGGAGVGVADSSVESSFVHDSGLIKAYRKVGSLQEFVYHDGVVSDWDMSRYSTLQVQKIALLDLRLCNLDRNDANILVVRIPLSELSEEEQEASLSRKGPDPSMRLVPIDHGYSIPDCKNASPDAWSWAWLEWPQVREPVHPKVRAYVEALDPDDDARRLVEELAVRQECADVVRIMGHLVKRGVARGLTLYDIAQIAVRQDGDGRRPSMLENLIVQAADLADHMVHNTRVRAEARMARARDSLRRSTETGASGAGKTAARAESAGHDRIPQPSAVGGAAELLHDSRSGGASSSVGLSDPEADVASHGQAEDSDAEGPEATANSGASDGSETEPKKAAVGGFPGLLPPTKLNFAAAASGAGSQRFAFGATGSRPGRAGPIVAQTTTVVARCLGEDGPHRSCPSENPRELATREVSESSVLEADDGFPVPPFLLNQSSVGALPSSLHTGDAGRADYEDAGFMFSDLSHHSLDSDGAGDDLDATGGSQSTGWAGAGHSSVGSVSSDDSAPGVLHAFSPAGVLRMPRTASMPAFAGVPMSRHSHSVSDDGSAQSRGIGFVGGPSAPSGGDGKAAGFSGASPAASTSTPLRHNLAAADEAGDRTPASASSKVAARMGDVPPRSTERAMIRRVLPDVRETERLDVGSDTPSSAVVGGHVAGSGSAGTPATPPMHQNAATALLARTAGAAAPRGGGGSPGRLDPIGLIRVSSYSGPRKQRNRRLTGASGTPVRDALSGIHGAQNLQAQSSVRRRDAALHRQYFVRYLHLLIDQAVDEVARVGVIRRHARSGSDVSGGLDGGGGGDDDAHGRSRASPDSDVTTSSSDSVVGLGITGPLGDDASGEHSGDGDDFDLGGLVEWNMDDAFAAELQEDAPSF